MSKKWKIVVGVLVALVVVAAIALSVVGVVVFRNRMHEQGWVPQMRRWESEQGIRPSAPRSGLGECPPGDDGSRTPDRGMPCAPAYGRFAGRGFGPGTGMMGHAFGPFRFVGGLIGLVFFVAVVGLAFAAGRHWQRKHPAAVPTQPTQPTQ